MFISGMNIIKWKLKIKNIGGIQRIQIFSLNSNKLINIVNEETEIFFYTLIDQKKVLVKIDENHFDIDTNTTSYKYEDNSIVKAILFYNIENTYKYNTEQQNIISDYDKNLPQRNITNNNKYAFQKEEQFLFG